MRLVLQGRKANLEAAGDANNEFLLTSLLYGTLGFAIQVYVYRIAKQVEEASKFFSAYYFTKVVEKLYVVILKGKALFSSFHTPRVSAAGAVYVGGMVACIVSLYALNALYYAFVKKH